MWVGRVLKVGWGRVVGESNERDYLMWEGISGLGRNLVPGNPQKSSRNIKNINVVIPP